MIISQANLIYRGDRSDPSGAGNVTVARNGRLSPLPVRLDLRKHSPDGFSWGYSGSGPAQLSLGMLADYFGSTPEGDCLALAIYQFFKDTLIAGLADDIWELSGTQVGEAIVRLMVENDGVISHVLSRYDTFLSEEWFAAHENSESLEDHDLGRIKTWVDDRMRSFLRDYLPLKPETVGRMLLARNSEMS